MNRPPQAFAKILVLLVAFTMIGMAAGLTLTGTTGLTTAATLHMVFAMAIIPLIFGAITYFVPVLTRTGAPERTELIPAGLAFTGGITLLVSFIHQYGLFPVAAIIDLTAVIWLQYQIHKRTKQCLGNPHPCVFWYQIALAMLALALIAITMGFYWPEQWLALRRFHLHLNLLGFVGLTALATLRVLIPTATKIPDPLAGSWLAKQHYWAGTGVVLISLGAAWYPAIALIGALLLMVPLAFFAKSLYIDQRQGLKNATGAVPALATATTGFLLLHLSSGAHIHDFVGPQDFTRLFILVFLLPLVTGAATHLIPLWLIQITQKQEQQWVLNRLGRHTLIRVLLFLLSALLLLANSVYFAIPAAIALLQFFYLVVSSWYKLAFSNKT